MRASFIDAALPRARLAWSVVAFALSAGAALACAATFSLDDALSLGAPEQDAKATPKRITENN
jgi:hypothetical protein